jgi:hypothetical protein
MTKIREVVDRSGWFTGAQRQAKCPECGAEYTQVQFTPAWMAFLRKKNPATARAFVDGWANEMCPTCTHELIYALWLQEEAQKHRATHAAPAAPRAALRPPAEAPEFAL